MDWTQSLLIVAVAAVMGSFGGGIIWNIRRGNAVLRWMQGGLPALGEKTTLRWHGSSAVELAIAKAKQPFRRFELVVVLEPRDVPWLWLWSYARGRRDMLILRAQLSNAPRLEYDVVAPGSWSARSALTRAAGARWENRPIGNYRLLAPRASMPVSSEGVPGLLENAHKVHPSLWRLAIRREFPQLELHIPLPDPKDTDARQFFEAVRALGQRSGEA